MYVRVSGKLTTSSMMVLVIRYLIVHGDSGRESPKCLLLQQQLAKKEGIILFLMATGQGQTDFFLSIFVTLRIQ